jgi:parvulin-like peptidyl-prolyl isomerase
VKRKFYYQLALEELIRSVRPTDAEVEKLYKERPDLFVEKEHAQASHIFSPNRKKIERIRKEIAAGADFGEVARKESEDDTTSENGGSLGWVVRDPAIHPAFLDAVFNQPIGAVGDVIRTDTGFHLVKVTERVPERRVPLAEARNRLLYRMTMERLASKRKAVLAEEKGKAKIETFPDRIPPSKPDVDLKLPGTGTPGGTQLPGGHPTVPGINRPGGFH